MTSFSTKWCIHIRIHTKHTFIKRLIERNVQPVETTTDYMPNHLERPLRLHSMMFLRVFSHDSVHGQTDRQMEATKHIISPASRSINIRKLLLFAQQMDQPSKVNMPHKPKQCTLGMGNYWGQNGVGLPLGVMLKITKPKIVHQGHEAGTSKWVFIFMTILSHLSFIIFNMTPRGSHLINHLGRAWCGFPWTIFFFGDPPNIIFFLGHPRAPDVVFFLFGKIDRRIFFVTWFY